VNRDSPRTDFVIEQVQKAPPIGRVSSERGHLWSGGNDLRRDLRQGFPRQGHLCSASYGFWPPAYGAYLESLTAKRTCAAFGSTGNACNARGQLLPQAGSVKLLRRQYGDRLDLEQRARAR
jgi:hypothetical protein